MPCYSTEREEKHYYWDGYSWRLISELRYIGEPIVESEDQPTGASFDGDKATIHYGVKGQKFGKRKEKEEVQVPMNEQFERDLGKLKAKLKNKFYEQGYLTVGDMLDILRLDAGVTNPFILYTGNCDKYRQDMEKLGMKFYREARPITSLEGSKKYQKFLKVAEALDDLDNTPKSGSAN